MAEGLGTGLQNLLLRFKSGRDLRKKPFRNWGGFFYAANLVRINISAISRWRGQGVVRSFVFNPFGIDRSSDQMQRKILYQDY